MDVDVVTFPRYTNKGYAPLRLGNLVTHLDNGRLARVVDEDINTTSADGIKNGYARIAVAAVDGMRSAHLHRQFEFFIVQVDSNNGVCRNQSCCLNDVEADAT